MEIQMQELIVAYKEKVSDLDHNLMIHKLLAKKQDARILELEQLLEKEKNDDTGE